MKSLSSLVGRTEDIADVNSSHAFKVLLIKGAFGDSRSSYESGS